MDILSLLLAIAGLFAAGSLLYLLLLACPKGSSGLWIAKVENRLSSQKMELFYGLYFCN